MMFLAVDPPADLSPADRLLRAGLVGARRKGGNPHVHRGRLRVAQRLAGGLTPAQAARLEGCRAGTVDALLEQEGFSALVEAHAELEALTPEQRTARLVRLARLALENALLADWDVGAACFVLDEHRQGRDPAVTIAEGAAEAVAKRAAPPSPAKPPGPLAPLAPLRPYDPLNALVRRSTAALRRATLDEHALRHAAQAADGEPTGTAAAARRALELKAEAAPATRPAPESPIFGEPAPEPAAASPGTPPEPHPPQRPRAP